MAGVNPRVCEEREWMRERMEGRTSADLWGRVVCPTAAHDAASVCAAAAMCAAAGVCAAASVTVRVRCAGVCAAAAVCAAAGESAAAAASTA